MKRHCAGITLVAGVLTAPVAGAVWNGAPPLNTPRCGAAVVVDQAGKVYVIGGRVSWTPDLVNGTATDTVEVLDPKSPTPQWTVMTQTMITRREYHAAACVGGFLYVFGGSNSFVGGTVHFESAERLDLLDPDRVWEAIPSMPTARNAAGAGADRYGRIIVIGGESSPGGPNLDIVERYDPARGGCGDWEALPPLNNARSRPGVALDVKGLIYVIGGGVNEGEVLSVERLDPSDPNPVWEVLGGTLPNVDDLQQGVTATTGADGRIYATGVGGTFRYNPNNDGWQFWAPLPAPFADTGGIDSNASATDDNGTIWIAGACEGNPLAAVHALDGPCGSKDSVRSLLDVDADRTIGISDFLELLSRWGTCP